MIGPYASKLIGNQLLNCQGVARRSYAVSLKYFLAGCDGRMPFMILQIWQFLLGFGRHAVILKPKKLMRTDRRGIGGSACGILGGLRHDIVSKEALYSPFDILRMMDNCSRRSWIKAFLEKSAKQWDA